MDSSVSPKDEIWFLRVCHHISNAVDLSYEWKLLTAGTLQYTSERLGLRGGNASVKRLSMINGLRSVSSTKMI